MTEEEIKALKESAEKLEAKNKELLEEKRKEKERADLLAKEKADAEAVALKEKGDFKTLVEKYEAEKKASDEKAANSEKARIEEKKKNALSLELDKLGIIPERKAFVMASVALDSVTFNETANVVLGADTKAKEIQATAPELFGKPVNIPGQGAGNGKGSGNGGSAPAMMTDEWFNSLSIADQDKYRSEYLKNKGITMRKGAAL